MRKLTKVAITIVMTIKVVNYLRVGSMPYNSLDIYIVIFSK